MNTTERMNELGLMGEKVVINYLSSVGSIVEQSIDKYDSEKDLVCDGLKIEVKTQVPFIKEGALTFKPNQLRKCQGVDKLFFVTVPAPRHFYKWSGWLFEVNPKEFTYKKYRTKDGREMVLIPIEQESVRPIQKIKDEYVEQLVKYTVSEY
jgi:hypothetical protein